MLGNKVPSAPHASWGGLGLPIKLEAPWYWVPFDVEGGLLCMVIAPTALVIASTTLSRLNKLFSCLFLLQSLVQLSLHLGNLSCLGIDFVLPLPGIAGQMFWVPTFHGCSGYICPHTLFSLAIEHKGQPTPKLGETLGVRGRQALSPGHHSEIWVSQILHKLIFQWLVGLIDKFRFPCNHLPDRICNSSAKVSSVSLVLWHRFIKVSNQGADSLTRLKSEAQMVDQSLKWLLLLGGQAQIIFYLTSCLLWGIIFHQLDCFPLGQATLNSVNPDVLQPGLKNQASIRGVASFKIYPP